MDEFKVGDWVCINNHYVHLEVRQIIYLYRPGAGITWNVITGGPSGWIPSSACETSIHEAFKQFGYVYGWHSEFKHLQLMDCFSLCFKQLSEPEVKLISNLK
jgi:hypothetical protein